MFSILFLSWWSRPAWWYPTPNITRSETQKKTIWKYMCKFHILRMWNILFALYCVQIFDCVQIFSFHILIFKTIPLFLNPHSLNIWNYCPASFPISKVFNQQTWFLSRVQNTDMNKKTNIVRNYFNTINPCNPQVIERTGLVMTLLSCTI